VLTGAAQGENGPADHQHAGGTGRRTVRVISPAPPSDRRRALGTTPSLIVQHEKAPKPGRYVLDDQWCLSHDPIAPTTVRRWNSGARGPSQSRDNPHDRLRRREPPSRTAPRAQPLITAWSGAAARTGGTAPLTGTGGRVPRGHPRMPAAADLTSQPRRAGGRAGETDRCPRPASAPPTHRNSVRESRKPTACPSGDPGRVLISVGDVYAVTHVATGRRARPRACLVGRHRGPAERANPVRAARRVAPTARRDPVIGFPPVAVVSSLDRLRSARGK
jgi:hypothetical protein